MNKDETARVDKELDTHFAEMGDQTEGYMAFLINSNQGAEVRFDTRRDTLLNEQRLARFGQKVMARA